jgi:hypothetical protein
VSISGSAFTGATTVSFDGTPAVFTTASDSQITAFTPAGAASGTIRVTTAAGTGVSAATFTVTVTVTAAAPTITGLTPTTSVPQTTVTIIGSHLTGATRVTFGGVSASFTVNSDTQITTTVPRKAVTGYVKVTTPGGTATSSTTFTVTPRQGRPH